MMAENEETAATAMPAGVTATPRDSIGSVGLSFSSGSTSMSTSCSSSSISIKTALNECTSAWITYLNVLNNLCAAGSKLAHTIAVLEQYGVTTSSQANVTSVSAVCGVSAVPGGDKSAATQPTTTAGRTLSDKSAFQNHPSSYLTNSWNDLARATAVATSTVKSHIMAVLQDFVALSTLDQPSTICDMEQKRIRDHNEMIVLENAQTMINIQHQFCAASYDAFSSLTCCFVCQSPVGFPHEQDCTMIKQKTNAEQRSQTPSPHFGGSCKNEASRGNSLTDQRPLTLASTVEQTNFSMEQRGSSPQQSIRETIPLQAIFENTRGPLPNPGHLLAMKVPFYRSAKSPLNFPLFPLNGQRRWSEAAAGEVIDENSTDAESQMRRWSMPWEASKTDQNTVTWYQTRIMPMNTFKLTNQRMTGSERSNSNTPDSNWQSSITSQDGLTEAIQLLSCRPTRNHPSSMPHTYALPPTDPSNTE